MIIARGVEKLQRERERESMVLGMKSRNDQCLRRVAYPYTLRRRLDLLRAMERLTPLREERECTLPRTKLIEEKG